MALAAKRRLALVACATFGLAGTLAGWRADGDAMREGMLRHDAAADLGELAALGGLLDEDGTMRLPEGLAVELVHSGEAAWVVPAMVSAVDDNPAFMRQASQHLLRAESISNSRGFAVQLRLFRRGWDVLPAAPMRRRAQPEFFAVAIALGALVAGWSRRWVPSALVAAALVLGLLAVFPIGGSVPAFGGFWDELAHAPAWSSIRRWMGANEELSRGIGIATITFCAVLAYFDHRRSKGREGSMSMGRAVWGALGLGVALLVLGEAAMRSGWAASLTTGLGIAGALGLLAACVSAGLAASPSRDEA